MSPVIGITAYVEPASWRVWRDMPAALVPMTYVHHVRAAGGLPVVLPPARSDPGADVIDSMLGLLDGLLLVGGPDVDPARYGEEAHPSVERPRPDRDATELALVQRARERDLPVLGVCRGMEVIAVAAAGRLEQHLPDRLGSDEHAPAAGEYGVHSVDIAAGSRLAGILGDQVEVSSYHHQGVLTHPGLEPVAWADDDVLEAVEDPSARFCVGVLWHPEVGTDPRLFEALVEAAHS